MTFSSDLHRRLLLAIVSTAACHKEASPKPDTKVDAAATVVTDALAAVATTSDPSPPAIPVTTATDTPPPPKPTSRLCSVGVKERQDCVAPLTNARSTGTGERAPAPPPSAYNAQGCLPKELVSDGCCNGAVAGPRFQGGKCCYTFCATGMCCGRPFLVHGAPRVAETRPSRQWLANLEGGGAVSLDPEAASSLAEAWIEDARIEHASAAAFARFVLQLMALGAPPELVASAALAAADEVKHAELCFALAARIDGAALGPMPLTLDGALDARSLEAVITEVVIEGCIGETIAALVASRRLDVAVDTATRRALERIRDDEGRHAELAWRFMRWAVDLGGDGARAVARTTFARALGEPKGTSALSSVAMVDAHAWHAHGRLLPQERAEIVRAAIDEIIMPCAHSLLD